MGLSGCFMCGCQRLAWPIKCKGGKYNFEIGNYHSVVLHGCSLPYLIAGSCYLTLLIYSCALVLYALAACEFVRS